MKQKKRYTPEEKSIILREYLEDKTPISALSEKYNLHPNAIYVWKKQLFENAPQSIVKTKHIEKTKSKQEQRIADLEALLAKRENLIAELASELIEEKKRANGDNFATNGLNRMRGTK
jgi:transposase-like protein